ncbi:DUF5615 family PIN-like protein [Deltaproteobacteria bacterium TL4]
MHLLFAQNLSPKLVEKLADIYPSSKHVQDIGFGDASDPVIWDYAKTNGYTIVTKDSDFHERRIIFGTPPDIIWIRRGNCSIQLIEKLLRVNLNSIEKLPKNEKGFIIIQ